MSILPQLLCTIVGLLSIQSNLALLNCTVPTAPKGPACDDDIFCSGPILDKVQKCSVFPDGKTFVDLKLAGSRDATKAKFQELMDAHNNSVDCEQVGQYVTESFDGPNFEFENWIPTDWKANPKFIDSIQDSAYKAWAQNLNTVWKNLGRKILPDVKANPGLYTIIYVDNPFIVPGGRFREYYYWDSFWIIQGLLHSEMYDTVKGMLYNFRSLIDTYGYIPNGGRVYYLKRSQPPLYAMMCEAYVNATGDEAFAKEIVPTLEKEFQFWVKKHTVSVQGYDFFTYSEQTTGPRPESYDEDTTVASRFSTDVDKEAVMSELKAAAESGMDFSSRWFINSDGTNSGDLSNTKTRSIIPVDLNAYLYRAANIISKYYHLSGNLIKEAVYFKYAESISAAIQAVLWDPVVGIWLDYDMINNKRRNYFTPSNLAPLWVQSFDDSNCHPISEQVVAYLTETAKVTSYPGGIPNTLYNTGEKWDFPNGWAPMLYLVVTGLENVGTTEAKALAKSFVKTWLSSNYDAYTNGNSMFDKYNAEIFGAEGLGGEYATQLGFGWSNGVVMHFLANYGDSIQH